MDIVLEEVHLESSTACNANCTFCPHSDIKRRGMMEFSLFKKIVDEAVDLGCQHFAPFRFNEPLIFPHLWEWLDYIRSKKVFIGLATNAGNLTDEIANKLIEYKDAIFLITIGFHGGTKAIYEHNVGLDFDKVRSNVVNFISKEPGITTDIFCLRRSATYAGENAFLNLWKGLPFHSVRLVLSMEWAGERPDSMTLRAQREGHPLQYIPCSRILRQLDVNYDGWVSLCCVDAHSKILFGNLKEQSIVEIWNNPLRQFYSDYHNTGKSGLLPLCDKCSWSVKDS